MTTATDLPLHKGFFGVDYRTQIGLHRPGSTISSPESFTEPLWDVFVGPLPFLLAPSEEDPYVRESTPIKRDRFDAPRDSGENTLDANVWLRSWTSWHMGAGQEQAEPLEQAADVARFRFDRSAGIDIWTAGHLSLLRRPTQRVATGVRRCLGVPGRGVVVSTDTGLRMVTESGNSSLSTTVGRALAVSSSRWVMIGDDGKVYFGPLTGGSESSHSTIAGATACVTAKDRLWVGAGPRLYEITALDSTPATNLVHTFNDGVIVDIDSGAGGVYVMVAGALTSIYVITSQDNGDLNPPREVAILPRGETGQVLYGYLSRYLLVGTSKGVRLADCSESTVLPLGPLTIEMAGQGCVDAVADGNFTYVTTGSENIDAIGDGSEMRPGLYRIDLSRITMMGQQYGETAASRFAYATDMYAPVSGLTTSVTEFDGRVWFAAGGALFMRGDDPVDTGWLDTGEVSYTTAERKAWQSLTVETTGSGSFVVMADTSAGFRPATQTVLSVPYAGDVLIDSSLHPASKWLNVRVMIFSDEISPGLWQEPEVAAFGLRAMVSPRRTRFIRLPLACFDQQLDRNQAPVGYEGFAFDRISDLEAMEQAGQIITVTDIRTQESINVQIERITFTGVTPPDRIRSNDGGRITLTLVTV